MSHDGSKQSLYYTFLQTTRRSHPGKITVAEFIVNAEFDNSAFEAAVNQMRRRCLLYVLRDKTVRPNVCRVEMDPSDTPKQNPRQLTPSNPTVEL